MLIEHFAGAFPMWLSPEQVRVLPLSDKSLEYAIQVARQLTDAGLKATVDERDGKVRQRFAMLSWTWSTTWLWLVPKEAESGEVALRDRIDGDLGSMKIAEAIAKLKQEVEQRVVRQAVASTVAPITQSDETKKRVLRGEKSKGS